MPLSYDTDHDDEELVRYVLGLLPDEARERFDEASIADDELAARLRVVETDLIDSYVRGKLAGETLAQFESYYLSSPRRRESVMSAASFIDALDRSATRAETVTWKDRLTRPTRVAWILAAAAVVIAVSGVLVFRAPQPRNETTTAASDSAAVERGTRTADQQLPGAARTEGLERDRSPASASTSPASESPEGTPIAPQQDIVAVVLLPPTRAVANIPTLTIPGAKRVRFELRLESNDFPRYRVGLKNPATNRILWRSEWIPPSSSADQASVSVVVPTNLLGPQHYSLDLAGRGAGGRTEVIGSYPVRIVQP